MRSLKGRHSLTDSLADENLESHIYSSFFRVFLGVVTSLFSLSVMLMDKTSHQFIDSLSMFSLSCHFQSVTKNRFVFQPKKRSEENLLFGICAIHFDQCHLMKTKVFPSPLTFHDISQPPSFVSRQRLRLRQTRLLGERPG